jgi:RNA polymerase sigma-70 factor (ECF subfamily)
MHRRGANLRLVDSPPPHERVEPARDDDGLSPIARAFRQYSPYVAAIALRLLGRDHEIDDVVQDVFLHAFRGADKLRQKDAFKAWLATITVRVARRRLRMRRLRGWLRFDRSPDYESVVAPGASPEDRALLGRVYRILDMVPVEQRLAWALRYVHGSDLEEVAQACGCSLATVKRRIAAAQAAVESAVQDG